MNSSAARADIKKKLKIYNDFHGNNSNLQIKSKEEKGSLVLEGQLRIHWGILNPIHFKQRDDGAPSPALNSREPDFTEDLYFYGPGVPLWNGKPVDRTLTLPRGPQGAVDHSNYASVMIRGDLNRKRTKKRVSILNGHIYNTETNLFTPSYGSAMNVNVTSKQTAPQVVRLFLDKFKVENSPEIFCLVLVKCNGETLTLKESEYPLTERILHGPNEDDIKMFIMEKSRVYDINEQVAQYVNLPESMLLGFLEKLKKDEEFELKLLKERHQSYMQRIHDRMAMLRAPLEY